MICAFVEIQNEVIIKIPLIPVNKISEEDLVCFVENFLTRPFNEYHSLVLNPPDFIRMARVSDLILMIRPMQELGKLLASTPRDEYLGYYLSEKPELMKEWVCECELYTLPLNQLKDDHTIFGKKCLMEYEELPDDVKIAITDKNRAIKIMSEKCPESQRVGNVDVVLAGGFLTNIFTQKFMSDSDKDFFVVFPHDENKTEQMRKKITSILEKFNQFGTGYSSTCAIDYCVYAHIQLIRRIYSSHLELMLSFDLDAACLYFHKNKFMFSWRFVRAIRYGNLTNRFVAGFDYIGRLSKYKNQKLIPEYIPMLNHMPKRTKTICFMAEKDSDHRIDSMRTCGFTADQVVRFVMAVMLRHNYHDDQIFYRENECTNRISVKNFIDKLPPFDIELIREYVNPTKQELKKLVIYIKDWVDELFKNENVNCVDIGKREKMLKEISDIDKCHFLNKLESNSFILFTCYPNDIFCYLVNMIIMVSKSFNRQNPSSNISYSSKGDLLNIIEYDIEDYTTGFKTLSFENSHGKWFFGRPDQEKYHNSLSLTPMLSPFLH